MTTATATLTDFLLARIAEDKARAGAVPSPVTTGGRLDTLTGRARARFVADWQPARVLAECEAKRKQVEHLIRFMENDYAPWNEEQLQIMAAVYSDHPEYREEWRP
jgi:hypothetical protein